MKKYSHLKKIIEWAEAFEKQLPEGEQWDDENFSCWLAKQVSSAEKPVKEKAKPAIPMFILFLYKYALFYSRKILKTSKIYSLDDFSFLASLLPDKELTKAEVIRKNISEKSSGNEVLKRLLREGLIVETKHPSDKRSKLLRLSMEGLNEINAVRSQFEKMAVLVGGDLLEEEKTMLLAMLAKLHNYHNPIFNANDEKALQEKLGIEN